MAENHQAVLFIFSSWFNWQIEFLDS